MKPWDKSDNRRMFDQMIEATGVKNLWPLHEFVKDTPPLFKFDYEVAYSILAMLGAAEIRYAYPVYVNKKGVGEVFGVTKKNINEYLDWFVQLGLIRKY